MKSNKANCRNRRSSLLFAIILFVMIWTGSTGRYNDELSSQVPSRNPSSVQENHLHHRMEVKSGTSSKKVTIIASEFSFEPSYIHLTTNEPLHITMKNAGKVNHDFEVIGQDIRIHTKPGSQSSSSITFSKSGTYQAVCTVPGHKEAGMTIQIHVSPA